MFEAASEDTSQINFAPFGADAQTNDSGNCLSGCGGYGFASAGADWLRTATRKFRTNGRIRPIRRIAHIHDRSDTGGQRFLEGVAGPINGQDNWAGPGGMGPPTGTGDWKTAVPDYNFNTNGITIGSYFNPTLSPATSKALRPARARYTRASHAGRVQTSSEQVEGIPSML